MRIVNDSGIGHQTKVFVEDANGNEVDISRYVRSVAWRASVGDVASADLEAVIVKIDARVGKSELFGEFSLQCPLCQTTQPHKCEAVMTGNPASSAGPTPDPSGS